MSADDRKQLDNMESKKSCFLLYVTCIGTLTDGFQFMAAFVASFLGGQPLLISGVTGPITVFNKTIYDIFKDQDVNYLHFIGWTYLWAAIFHWIGSLMNAVKGLRYVTRFACDTFGFYVAAVYVQYGIQVVTRQFEQSSAPAGFLGIM